MLGSMVKAIAKEKAEVVIIVPGGMCPGHFDIKPSNLVELNESKVIFCHGWEPWIKKLMNTVDKKPMVVTIKIKGSLMVPEEHKKAVRKVTKVLCSLDPQHTNYYKKNLTSYEMLLDSLEKEIKKRTQRIKKTPVICSKFQAEFLEWLGMEVRGTYGRPEELTPKTLLVLINKAKRERVRLVVDNLQSGPDAGAEIAKETKAKHVTLTNFPLNDSYPATLMENIEKLIHALK